jgi:membrane-bound lytic murein transglycosylase D
VLQLLRNLLILLSLSALAACAPLSPRSSNTTPPAQLVAKPAGAPVQTAAAGLATAAMPQPAAAALAATSPALPASSAATDITASPAPLNIGSSAASSADPQQCDVWQRIRDGYAMPEIDSKLIAQYERFYARQPEYVTRMAERARRYLYFITEEVNKRGMPTEIALLPMIESAFNPGAYSSARASGIWQFIPSTGKHFGMEQNWWYDGRRDVISATNGALDYLQKLHDQFGAWDLALAAYNCGERCVMKAQSLNRKRHLPTDYVHLKLPKETRHYVPKLLAVKNIIAYPMSFGLIIPEVPNQPYFAAVTTSRHMDVKLAAEMAEISMEEFTALNPAHNRPVILTDKDNMLLLPVEKVDVFRANLERANQPLVSWQEYQPKKGEKLDQLAPRFGISVEKLKAINGLSPRAQVCNGQALLVPVVEGETAPEFAAFNTHLAPTDQLLLNAVSHTVRRGDTLSGIARRYHVKLASLKSWNRGVKLLRPGQKILVAQSSAKPRRIAKASKSRSKAVVASRATYRPAGKMKAVTYSR